MTLSVIAMFVNISDQEIDRTIISQIVYIRMQNFEVVVMHLSFMPQKFSKMLSITVSEKSPFLAVLGYKVRLCLGSEGEESRDGEMGYRTVTKVF